MVSITNVMIIKCVLSCLARTILREIIRVLEISVWKIIWIPIIYRRIIIPVGWIPNIVIKWILVFSIIRKSIVIIKKWV